MHLLALALVVVGLGAGADAQPGGAEFGPERGAPDGSGLVRMSVMSDFSSVTPGQEMTLAVRYRIEDEWHLYWRNPGETGLPPAVTFEAPSWLTVGEAIWAAPTRHEIPGPIVDFIYEKDVVLLFPARVSDDAPAGTRATIKAKSDWLVCKRECLFGAGEGSVTIGVVESAPARSPAAATIQTWREKAPRRLDEARDPGVQVSWRGATLVIEAPGAERVTFFPYPVDEDTDAMPRDILREGETDSDRLEVSYDNQRLQGAERVRGVVTIILGEDESSWEFELATERAADHTPE